MTITKRIPTKVRGTTFRSVDFDTIKPGDALDLQRQPDNPSAPNTIKVLYRGTYVGYIGRKLAAQVAPAIDSGTVATAVVDQVTGGADHATNQGINIIVTLEERFDVDDLGPPWAV